MGKPAGDSLSTSYDIKEELDYPHVAYPTQKKRFPTTATSPVIIHYKEP